MSGDCGVNEWNLLKHQFDALVNNESELVIEEVFDVQFRRRFAELIDRAKNLGRYDIDTE
jgi:hypothetical protein